MEKNWKASLFTWIYRIFTFIIPGGYALWTFLIETLINKKASIWDKIDCSAIFVIIIICLIAIFFYGRHLKSKIKKYTDACIECIDNDKKGELVHKKKKWEAKQELFRNACFIAPFVIAWFLVTMIEKQVVSLRGTLLVISISMATGLGFNGIAQWLKAKRKKVNKNEKVS